MNLISGMHRSGTSLVARFFYEAGADLGDPRTFYRPDRWNPDGYFEQPEIHDINMPLINGPWGKLAYFHLPSTQTIMNRAMRMSAQISRTAGKFRGKVVKETRFCLTLPAWLEHGAVVDSMTVCLRHPTDVARSLQRRNRITAGMAYKLWRIHLERLLQHVGSIPTRFVRYDHILDSHQVYQELHGALQFAGVTCDQPQMLRLHQQLVRPNAVASSQHSRRMPRPVSELWDDLLQIHASQN